MDDFNISSLHDSRNEWCVRLVNVLTPLIIEGVKSIFDESCKMCEDNDEAEKYLMTFQNLISRIPKWNQVMIGEEKDRILIKSSCPYLEDLISCVHIIQLKTLTCVRVGKQQKKIDIAIPSLDAFIHKVYINVARKLYTNVYLFDAGVSSLEKQKMNREFELVVKECIMNTIRDNIPVESLLRAYIDDTDETDVVEKEEVIETVVEPVAPAAEAAPAAAAVDDGHTASASVAVPASAPATPAVPAPAMTAPALIVNDKKDSSENVSVIDIKTEVSTNTTAKPVDTQIIVKDPEPPKIPSLDSLAGISSDLKANDMSLQFNTVGEALGMDGIKEKFNPLDQPEKTTDYDADDDDDDKIKIGGAISLDNVENDMFVKDLGEKPVLNTDSLLDIEVLN